MVSYHHLRSGNRTGYSNPCQKLSHLTQKYRQGINPSPTQVQRRLGNSGTLAWLVHHGTEQSMQLKDRTSDIPGRDQENGEELVFGKFDQIQTRGSKEKLLQGKYDSNGTLAENHTGIPDSLKSGLELLSGLDLSAVRVKTNSSNPAQLNALAYTQGQDIHVAPGQEKHLPHEGWHAVQQMQGRVNPTTQAKGVSINDDAALEREADVMGAKALQIGRATDRSRLDDKQSINSYRHKATTTRQAFPESGTSIQRAPAPISQIRKVRSLRIEEDLKPGVEGAENLLKKKIASRLKVIDTQLEELQPYHKQQWARKKLRDLLEDKRKSLREILNTPDSKWVHKNHRLQISNAHNKLEQRKHALKASKKAFHLHDKRFADTKVSDVLRKKGFTAADLKALVAQESGDFSMSDNKGDIAGPAQIGKRETREVGHKEEDRLNPSKFALVAAKVLIKKAISLEAGSPGLPAAGSEEYKKFVFASYNAGQGTIIEAQKKTGEFKRNYKHWDDVIKVAKVPAGYKTSGLHEGIKSKLPDLDANKKYDETVGYVRRIFRRLA